MEEFLSNVKRYTVSALASDDIFMTILVLKGGNAIDLAYNLSERGSLDIDFSIENDFTEKEKKRMQNQSNSLLNREFEKMGLSVFDVTFSHKPRKIDPSVEDFWGGYLLEFKLIETEKFEAYGDDINKLRREALSIGKKGSTKFTVDISKYEYVGKSQKKDLDGAIVQVYSPEMIVLEKLRAICQQTNEYREIIRSHTPRARARDFYDIANVKDHFALDFNTPENIELARNIFEAKKVQASLLDTLPNYKSFHADGWESVLTTLNQTTDVKHFDFYFDCVISIAKNLREGGL